MSTAVRNNFTFYNYSLSKLFKSVWTYVIGFVAIVPIWALVIRDLVIKENNEYTLSLVSFVAFPLMIIFLTFVISKLFLEEIKKHTLANVYAKSLSRKQLVIQAMLAIGTLNLGLVLIGGFLPFALEAVNAGGMSVVHGILVLVAEVLLLTTISALGLWVSISLHQKTYFAVMLTSLVIGFFALFGISLAINLSTSRDFRTQKELTSENTNLAHEDVNLSAVDEIDPAKVITDADGSKHDAVDVLYNRVLPTISAYESSRPWEKYTPSSSELELAAYRAVLLHIIKTHQKTDAGYKVLEGTTKAQVLADAINKKMGVYGITTNSFPQTTISSYIDELKAVDADLAKYSIVDEVKNQQAFIEFRDAIKLLYNGHALYGDKLVNKDLYTKKVSDKYVVRLDDRVKDESVSFFAAKNETANKLESYNNNKVSYGLSWVNPVSQWVTMFNGNHPTHSIDLKASHLDVWSSLSNDSKVVIDSVFTIPAGTYITASKQNDLMTNALYNDFIGSGVKDKAWDATFFEKAGSEYKVIKDINFSKAIFDANKNNQKALFRQLTEHFETHVIKKGQIIADQPGVSAQVLKDGLINSKVATEFDFKGFEVIRDIELNHIDDSGHATEGQSVTDFWTKYGSLTTSEYSFKFHFEDKELSPQWYAYLMWALIAGATVFFVGRAVTRKNIA